MSSLNSESELMAVKWTFYFRGPFSEKATELGGSGSQPFIGYSKFPMYKWNGSIWFHLYTVRVRDGSIYTPLKDMLMNVGYSVALTC